MREIYYESEFVKIAYDETQKLGVAVWTGFLSSNDFRESTAHCLNVITRYKLKRWLGDNRKMKAIRQADQQWMLDVVVPKLIESPLRRMANLVSEDIFNKMAVEQMIKRAGPIEDMFIRDFDKEDAALAWLLTPQQEKVLHQV